MFLLIKSKYRILFFIHCNLFLFLLSLLQMFDLTEEEVKKM